MFYSQFGEDRLLSAIFSGARTGSCVEVGANDGVNDSTTLHFEEQGWKCVLVEPNPELCQEIRKKRRGPLFECAASNQDGSATLHVAYGALRAHGVSGLGDARETSERIAKYGFAARPVTVRSRKLDDILEEARLPSNFDFISIDVEGHELQVLEGFSVERWRPTVILIEDNSEFADKSVGDYLRRFGYLPFRRTGVNDWYAHRTRRDLCTPSNRAGWNMARSKALARRRLRKVPGLVALVKLIRGH